MKRSLILPTPVCLYPTRHSTRRQQASRAMSTYTPSYRHSALTWSRDTCLLTQRTSWCAQHHTMAAEHVRQGFPVWRALGILSAIQGHLAHLALGPQHLRDGHQGHSPPSSGIFLWHQTWAPRVYIFYPQDLAHYLVRRVNSIVEYNSYLSKVKKNLYILCACHWKTHVLVLHI